MGGGCIVGTVSFQSQFSATFLSTTLVYSEEDDFSLRIKLPHNIHIHNPIVLWASVWGRYLWMSLGRRGCTWRVHPLLSGYICSDSGTPGPVVQSIITMLCCSADIVYSYISLHGVPGAWSASLTEQLNIVILTLQF